MLRTLRNRLIASHVFLLLITIAVTGIALVYVLETQVLLVNLAKQLAGQAVLVAEIAREEPAVWSDSAQAQTFVNRVAPLFPAQLMLLDAAGRVLASSDPADANSVGQRLELLGLNDALRGQNHVRVAYSQNLQAEIADIMVPVRGPAGRIVGVVRLTDQLGTVYERFLRLRTLIVAVLAVGLVLGGVVGWRLAVTLERPIRRVTQAVYQLAGGHQQMPLPEQGPDETRLLARAFNVLVERLRNLESARQQLLANLVHELGRPLGALNSAIQALSAGADADATLRWELLAGMGAEIQRLQRLLDDLAQLHGRVLGPLELARRPTALSEWLPEVLGPWREAAHQKGLEWQVTIPPTLPTVAIDPDRLAQAVGNLLSNAVKYTRPGGTVTVAAGAEAGAIWVRVSDTGPGIPPDEQVRIFDPFYRGPPDRRFPEGMGLGLAIARDLVIAHGGRLEVDSTPGRGSEFALWLPAGGGSEMRG
ncbi:MAG TPA: hypothetical protein DEP84_07100 [Chloroflexi bacterium]|nr:hypothetical protein [Chloroflexota bacterium]